MEEAQMYVVEVRAGKAGNRSECIRPGVPLNE